MAVAGVIGTLSAPDASAAASCKPKAMELPVTMVGTRAIATARINGVEIPLVVDSGAFFSMLTEAAAAQLKLPLKRVPDRLKVMGITGEVDTHLTRVEHLQLLGGEIPNVDFIVGGNEPGSGAMGILGRNLLTSLDAEYDLAHGIIRLVITEGDCSEANMAYWAGGTPVSRIELDDDRASIWAIKGDAHFNGKKVHVLFDTGATSVVSLDAARRAGVARAEMVPTRRLYGLGPQATDAWIAPVKTFEIGGEVIENSHLEVGDFDLQDIDMLLGMDFFLSHRIYVSRQQHRMYFTYSGGPVFALNRSAEESAAAASASASASAPASTAQAADPMPDAAGYARRGAASAARQDFANALADLDRACAMAPQSAAWFTRRAEVHAQLRQPELARQDLDEALRLDPAQAEARLARAAARQGGRDRDGALADLDVLDKTLAPQSPLRLSMANLYVRLGLRERALPQWNQWIEAHPDEAGLEDVLNDRCRTRALLGVELSAALDDCDEAVDRQPRNVRFLDSRGWVRLRLGQYAKAAVDFDRAVKIDPASAMALYGRGVARLRQGEQVLGQADIDAASKARPAVAAEAARYGLGP